MGDCNHDHWDRDIGIGFQGNVVVRDKTCKQDHNQNGQNRS